MINLICPLRAQSIYGQRHVLRIVISVVLSLWGGPSIIFKTLRQAPALQRMSGVCATSVGVGILEQSENEFGVPLLGVPPGGV